MAGHQGYPRRKHTGGARSKRDPEASPRPSEGPAGGVTREALDIAGYVADMTAQLEAMSLAAGLDLLAYFLGMARSEADLIVRTNAGLERESESPDGAGGAIPDEDQADFDNSGN